MQYGIAKARARWNDLLIWEAFYSGGMAIVFVLLPALLLKEMVPVDSISPVHSAVTKAFVVAAIPEEIAKFAAIFFAIRRYDSVRDRYDMITLAFAVALGFAAIENLAYLVAFGDWPLLAAKRAVMAVPMHGINGLAMGSFLAAAQRFPHRRDLCLFAALAVPILLHAGYDFPLMLVARNQAFFGVLPAWFLLVIFSTICVLWLSNKMRSSTDRAHSLPNQPSGPRLTGATLLVLVPVFAAVALVTAGDLGIVGAAAFSILPAILGIDLLRTNPTVFL